MTKSKTGSKKLTGRGLFWILFVCGFIPILFVLNALNASVVALVKTADSIEYPNPTCALLLVEQINFVLSDHIRAIRDEAKQLEHAPIENQQKGTDEIDLLIREFRHPVNGYFTDDRLYFAQHSYPLRENYQQQIMGEISKTEKRWISVVDSVSKIYLMLHKAGDTTRFDGTYTEYSIFKSNLPKIIDNIIDNSMFKRYFVEKGAMFEPSPLLSRYLYLTVTDDDKLVYERGPREEAGLQEYVKQPFWHSLQITVYGKFYLESIIVQRLKYFDIIFLLGLVMIVLGVIFLVRKRDN